MWVTSTPLFWEALESTSTGQGDNDKSSWDLVLCTVEIAKHVAFRTLYRLRMWGSAVYLPVGPVDEPQN